MKSLLHVLIFFSSLHLTFLCQNRISSVSAYTITPSQSIKDGQNLTSQSEAFELGFFSPSDSKNRYLGIWYKRIPLQTVVWVANGDSPLNDTSGVFTISSMGNLVILNGTNHTIWSTNLSTTAKNPILEFLESGNLVLRDGNNSDRYLWQSFDHPSDTMLPGMKLGWNLQTGLNRSMTSWKSFNDPSHGDFTYEIDLNVVVPEPVIRYGSSKYYRSGPFNGIRNSGSPDLKDDIVFKYVVVVNATEVSYGYRLVNQSVIARLVLKQNDNEGKLERYVWIDQSQRWVANEPIPRDSCDPYGLCGANSTCNTNDVPICQCLKGFKPKSPREWNENNRSQGCERQTPLECESGEGFVKFKEVKLPETTRSWTNIRMNTEDCKGKCLKNCSCMAYANSDISGGGSGCIMWFGDLIDMRELLGAGQDLYIRMPASELEADAPKETKRELKKKKQKLIITFSVIAAIFVLGIVIYFIWTKKKKSLINISTEVTNRDPQFCEEFMHGKRNYTGDQKNDDLELNLFDMDMILRVTQNFSQTNMLGQGGFGCVYKGTLENGQKIAVKRLSKSSGQGVEEFKNEVMLIARLQHRNLVRLLGFCIESEEKLLVYEYMENKGLDAILFNKAYKNILDWQTRFNIIMGISRGLLYLHQDSRFRIIHRDLKTSNVLLDGHLNPKISDFGMARIFGGDDTEGKTKRVVGTYGYMSPEYAMAGIFSVKSDVFSFGVVLLEIINGMKNTGYFASDNQVNLLGYAWKLWREGRSIELIDETVKVLCVPDEALRCIHIGLLCVQEHAEDRPTISTVVSMLSSHDTTTFQQPKPPGFFVRSPIEAGSSSSKQDSESCSVNNVTVTVLEAR